MTTITWPTTEDHRHEIDDAITEAIALADAGHKPEHDHAPGQGDIFTCPACIINANR